MIKNNINNLAKKLLKKLIRGYQLFISPLLPARCRYYPTCSNYGLQAVEWHGAGRGGWLAFKRICRCHPLGGHGIDFVPLPLYRFQFTYCGNLESYQTVYQDRTHYRHLLKLWLNGRGR